MAAVDSPAGAAHSATDRLREQTRAVTNDIQGIGAVACDFAQEKLGEMQENASALCEEGREKVRHATRGLEQYVAERPLTSVLIAAGVGLLLGRFWRRH